jgi:hypothetical protein
MSRAIVITVNQAKALIALKAVGCASATDFDRNTLEQCVRHGWVTKNQNGHAVTYAINVSGLAILRSL